MRETVGGLRVPAEFAGKALDFLLTAVLRRSPSIESGIPHLTFSAVHTASNCLEGPLESLLLSEWLKMINLLFVSTPTSLDQN